MPISFKERKFDEPSRKLLREICVGKGLDIGAGDRPITSHVKTLDMEPEYNPDIRANMQNIPLPDNSQDFIVASHVLEHTDNTIDTLKEWRRILKIDGKIGITVPNGELAESIDLGDGQMMHRTLFTAKTLGLFLEHVGFKNVESKEIKLDGYDKIEIIAFGEK